MLQTKTHVYFAKRIEKNWIETNSLLVNLLLKIITGKVKFWNEENIKTLCSQK